MYLIDLRQKKCNPNLVIYKNFSDVEVNILPVKLWKPQKSTKTKVNHL